MATVTIVFVGNLTDAEDVSVPILPASQPVLYVTHGGSGLVRLKVEVSAVDTGAVIEEITAPIRGGVKAQLVPKAFENPFNSVVVTTQATGVCTGIQVHLCEA